MMEHKADIHKLLEDNSILHYIFFVQNSILPKLHTRPDPYSQFKSKRMYWMDDKVPDDQIPVDESIKAGVQLQYLTARFKESFACETLEQALNWIKQHPDIDIHSWRFWADQSRHFKGGRYAEKLCDVLGACLDTLCEIRFEMPPKDTMLAHAHLMMRIQAL